MKTTRIFISLTTFAWTLLCLANAAAGTPLPAGDLIPDGEYHYRATRQCAAPEQFYYRARSELKITEIDGNRAFVEEYSIDYKNGKQTKEQVILFDKRDLLEPEMFSRLVFAPDRSLLRREKILFYPENRAANVVRYYYDLTGVEDHGIDKDMNEPSLNLPPDTYCDSMVRHAFRYFPFEVGQNFELGLLTRIGNIYRVKVEVTHIEKITVPAGQIKCYRVLFYPTAGWVPDYFSAFIPKGEAWFSVSKPHRLVKFYGLPQLPASIWDYQSYFEKNILILLNDISVKEDREEFSYIAYNLPLCGERYYFQSVWNVSSTDGEEGTVTAKIIKKFASGNTSREEISMRKRKGELYPVAASRVVFHPSRGMLRQEKMEFIVDSPGLAKPMRLKIFRNYADPLSREDHGLETIVNREERSVYRFSYSREMAILGLTGYPFQEGENLNLRIITRIGSKHSLNYEVGAPQEVAVPAGKFMCYPLTVFPSTRLLPARLTGFLPRLQYWYMVDSPHVLVKYYGPPNPPASILDAGAYREQFIDMELEKIVHRLKPRNDVDPGF